MAHKHDALSRLNDFIDQLMTEAYERDDIASALELQLMAMNEEDESEDE